MVVREQGRRKERREERISDVNKDWTCKDKDQAYKDQTCKDKGEDKDLTHKDKDFTYSYLLQVAAKPTIAIKQRQ